MRGSRHRGAQLAGLFLLGALLFSYPMLGVFNISRSVFGVPSLYAYLFGAWLLLIGLVAAVMERDR